MNLHAIVKALENTEKECVKYGMSNSAPNKTVELVAYCLRIVTLEVMALQAQIGKSTKEELL